MCAHYISDGDVDLQKDNRLTENAVLQKNRIQRRRASTVGSFYNCCNSLTAAETTTTTTSSSTTSQITATSSNSAFKKVSMSMSMERRDSIQYVVNPVINKTRSALPRGTVYPESIIPAGQNTVIHMDNYTKFMAQRVTTTRTAVCKEFTTTTKTNEIGVEEINDSPSSSSSGTLDINVQIVHGGCNKNRNKNSLAMQKQKLMETKSLNVASKIRTRKESIAIEMPPPPPPPPTPKRGFLEKSNSKKKTHPGTLKKTKPLLKRPKRTKTKKVKETKTVPQEKQVFQTNATMQQKVKLAKNKRKTYLPLKNSSCTQTDDDEPDKICKPCINLLQNKKCPQQLNCQYLHSDFPCKYYYSNLTCPDGAKCLFMHNGPLSVKLMSALQSHILDLLSGFRKPTNVESAFIQQIQKIDDLYKRLKDFQNNQCLSTADVIEVMDDDDEDEEQQILVIDESNDDEKNSSQSEPDNPKELSKNPLQNTTSSRQVLALVPYQNCLNDEYRIYKEANHVLNDIEDNLHRLKTDSSMTARDKSFELEKIYELLIRQDKLFVVNDNRVTNPNAPITTILRNDNNPRLFNNITLNQIFEHEGQQNVVLVNPEIVNNIQTITNSQDNILNLIDDKDDNFGENNSSETMNLEIPIPQVSIEIKTTDNISPSQTTDVNEKTLQKEKEFNDNMMNICIGNPVKYQKSMKITNMPDAFDRESNFENPSLLDMIDNNLNIWDISNPMEKENIQIKTYDLHAQEQFIDNVMLGEVEEGEIIETSSEDNGQSQEKNERVFSYPPNEDNDIETISKISTLLQEQQEMCDFNLTIDLDSEKTTSFNTTISSNTSNLSELKATVISTLREKENIIDNQTIQQNGRESPESNETISNIINALEEKNIKSISTKDVEMIDNNFDHNDLLQTSDPLNEEASLELAISLDERGIIEGGQSSNKDDEESPAYESITPSNDGSTAATTKTRHVPKNRIRLRSHTLQGIEVINLKSNNHETQRATTIETKTIKTRRLRLPKTTAKTIEKSSNTVCKIDPDLINKLIHESTSDNINKEYTKLQDVEAPITQNVIITNRFLKRAKAKLEQQLKQTIHLPETLEKNKDKLNVLNTADVELKMSSLHKENDKVIDNKLENFEVTFCTQTSFGDNQPLSLSQDPLHNENNEANNESQTNSTNIQNFSSASTAITATKQQFIIGSPHVVLTKINTSLLPATTQKQLQADSTTTTCTSSTNSPTNAVITGCFSSSCTIFKDNDDNSCHVLGQKRFSLTPESDLDKSLKADKIIKLDSSKNVRKINLNRKRYKSKQSVSESDDFNTNFSDEKPTNANVLQSSSPTDNKRAFKPSTAHQVTTQKQHHHRHHHVQYDEQHQKENESDLRQQIENVSNKSDLQLQTQQQLKQQLPQLQQQNEIKITNKTSNTLPYKQQQLQQQQEQEQQKQIEMEKIANTCNSYDNIQKVVVVVVHKDKQNIYQPSPSLQQTDENDEKATSNLANKCSTESISPAIFAEDVKVEENAEYFKYASLFNKLSTHTARRQINFENSSVNITPIASPTYVGDGNDTIASPSPVKGEIAFDYRMEVDGRMTYPPMLYILREIDLGKINVNKPTSIEKLAKTTYLDPRVFRSHIKKPTMSYSQPITSQAVVPLSYSTQNSALSSSSSSSSSSAYKTSSISPYDPRSRTTAIMPATPLPNQTALSCYDINPSTTLVPLGSDLTTPGAVCGLPLHHSHHHHQRLHSQTPQPTQQQQTPNMLLYGCLQRSPWYQSLMSPMKIQINQSISQLVRAINNFQRERLLNPEIVFDVFKIDIAGELLEIMRNLGIFVDANGVINEQRHVSTFGGRSCLNSTSSATIPVNATYSFIQQVLTPSTLGGTSMMTTASSSSYNAAAAAAAAAAVGGSLNEPFVSCYIEAPKIVQQQKSHDEVIMKPQSPQDDNNYSNNNNNNNNGGHNNNYNQNGNRRYNNTNNQFKKPYDSNSNQRGGSYNHNPRFNRSQNSDFNSPTRNSPPNSPRGGGGRGGGRGRGGGGRFNNNNNNRRYNNNASSWSSSSTSSPPQENRYNNKNDRAFNSNNSPTKSSSSPPQTYGKYKNSLNNNNNNSSSSPPPFSSSQQTSPRPTAMESSPTSHPKNSSNIANDEEDWD